jgi:phospholipase/lecithinase/hemolysin
MLNKYRFFPFSTQIRQVFLTVVLNVSFLIQPVAARTFSEIYSFGDSLVDTGNTFELTGLPTEPYFEGRLSNGLLWNEYLAQELEIPLTNLGFAGATSSELGLFLFGGEAISPVPGMLTQVSNFLDTSNSSIDSNALYTIWVGANDYLFAEIEDPSIPVNNITTAVTNLTQAGAENFLLVNLPDLGELPLIDLLGIPEEDVDALNLLSDVHNLGLEQSVQSLNSSGQINVDLLDINSLFRQALNGELGFENTTDACTLTPECLLNQTIQDTFLFWDEVHPTTTAYSLIADTAAAELMPVPEPMTIYGSFLTLGFCAALKHQKKLGKHRE